MSRQSSLSITAGRRAVAHPEAGVLSEKGGTTNGVMSADGAVLPTHVTSAASAGGTLVDGRTLDGGASSSGAPSPGGGDDSGELQRRQLAAAKREGNRRPPSRKGPFSLRLLNKVPIRHQGESGRSGVSPREFLAITLRSSNAVSRYVNVLWPFVPAAFIVNYLDATSGNNVLVFSISYVAMVPCANLIGFAGQEFARKLPHVFGVLAETSIGSIVEIVLFMVLLSRDEFQVIQAAILGSILATMLLCLGLCFFAGGIRQGHEGEQSFSEVVSEAGTGLLLTAGVALAVPTIFERSLSGSLEASVLSDKVLDISRVTAILLVVAYLVFIFYQARSHHGIYDAIFEEDERADIDQNRDIIKKKLTMTECLVALTVSVTLVTFVAIFLVERIEPIVHDHGISDAFMGLILVPVVEKAAEHLTAIDEAWDDQMNFALSHVLGATLQTALFNGPLVVLVGWGLHKAMSLNFELFNIAILILSIITVGNFLRDQKSNYLEGFLCVMVYVSIAVAAFYYPNPIKETPAGGGSEGGTGGSEAH